jgi:hypothetical protein
VTKPISIFWKSPIDFHVIPSVIHSSKGHLKRLRTKFMIRLTACWLGQICNRYEVKKNPYFRWRKQNCKQYLAKASSAQSEKATIIGWTKGLRLRLEMFATFCLPTCQKRPGTNVIS